VLFCIAVIGGSLAQLTNARDTVNADGINYIELAQRAAAGHLDFIANGYWSPLYPALIAVGLTLARPFHLDALPVARGVNLVAIVLCALAFEWLLATLERAAGRGEGSTRLASPIAIARRAAAYALLVWEVLRLQQATTVTPDLLVFATLACIAAFLVIRRARALTTREALAFGLVLGVAYLAKAVMLPVGMAALVVFAALAWRHGRGVAVGGGELARICVAFVVVAAPLIAVQTSAQGHLSFGETGRLNYRWYVSHVGEPRARDEPIAVTAGRTEANPAQVALTSVPGAVLHAGALRGSFPHGFDPSRSEPRDGARVDLASQRRVLRQNLYWYWVVAGTLTLLALLPIVLATLDRVAPRTAVWPALVPALALLALYLLTHVEGRLCGPAIVTVLVALLYAVVPAHRRGVRIGQIAAVVAVALVALLRTLSSLSFAQRGDPADGQERVARAAGARGLRAGEAIGVIGSAYGLYWVHLAGVRVSVVIPPPDEQHPLDLDGLERLVAETCARGTAVTAIVWRSGDSAVPVGVVGLDGGWQLWRPHFACPRPNVKAGVT
jgi:4-amino-4-deoxy-L-arabinose transferase-like glycosyltransferase